MGASGPTVGIGYDCRYSTPDRVRKAWISIISDESHGAISLYDYAGVTITWDQGEA